MTLDELRESIDSADRSLLQSFKKRMEVAQQIGLYKAERGLPVLDKEREIKKLNSICSEADPEIRPYVRELYETLFKLSRDKQSKAKFGVLGQSLPHSYSPMLHYMYQDEYEYTVIEKEPDELDNLFSEENRIYSGFNVTIPYKKEAYKRCAFLSEEAKAVGSVNTVVFDEDNKAHGYNTDIYGFTYLLTSNGIDVDNKKCLILGTGGASTAVEYSLKKLNAASVKFCSRTGEINYDNIYELCGDTDIIVNTTPVGMFPHADETPVEPAKFSKLYAVVDIVYNPGKTKLMSLASSCGVPNVIGGLKMLVAQGYKASLIFRHLDDELSADVAASVIDKAYKELEFKMKNIAFIGMPGCGKSTFARYAAERFQREVIDLDKAYEEAYGISPASEITANGEETFRQKETELLRDVAYLSGKVISCGGGIVTRDENVEILRANSIVVYLDRPLEILASNDRPLSARYGVEELYSRRHKLYENACDIKLTVDKTDSEKEFLNEAIQKLISEL